MLELNKNRLKVIGFAGPAQNGKDTCADFLVDKFGYTKYGMADPLKEMLYVLNPDISYKHLIENSDIHQTIFKEPCNKSANLKLIVDTVGWEDAKQIPEIRRLLQVFGTEVGREMIDEDLWVNLADRFIHNHTATTIAGVRFPNEAELIRKHNGIIIQVIRPDTDLLTKSANKHTSETSKIDPDFTIINDGTVEDLYTKLDQIVC